MWSCDRRLTPRRGVLLGAAALVAGCGFAPVYGTRGVGSALAGRVAVEPEESRYGILLTRELQLRFGPPTDTRYRLAIALSTRSDDISDATAQSINRDNLIGDARYLLTDAATGETVAEGDYDTFVSYSSAGTGVATDAAERDAYERLTRALADGILADLLARPELRP